MSEQVPVRELQRVSFIGFGEAGSILGTELAKLGLTVRTYDILLDHPATRAEMLTRADRAGVQACNSLAEVLADAQLVISAVTASSAAEVAEQAAEHMHNGQIFLDINSVSPGVKRKDQAAIERSGADYVECAVMAPIPPHRLKVPMLLGGQRAQALAGQLTALGMKAEFASTEIGVASAVKMCRSVMIKGIEALTVECLTAARRYGAEEAVLASLNQTFPSMGWTSSLPDYLISRVAEHGRRRAAEMREVAETLRDVGVTPEMSLASARTQDALVDAMTAAGITYPKDEPFSWQRFVDALSRQ